MQKDTYYFQHDYEPTSDPKMQALIKEYDWMGYGLYWRIVEMLHSDPTHKLPKKNFIFVSLSSTKTTVEMVVKFVESCINDFELFVTDGVEFWSSRVFKNIQERDDKRAVKSISGHAGGVKSGEARRSKAEAKLKQNEAPLQKNEANEAKERKGKERKGNVFAPPAEKDVLDYFKENGFSESSAKKAFNHYNVADWHDTNGKAVKNWKQKISTVWFKDEHRVPLAIVETLNQRAERLAIANRGTPQ